MQIVVTRESVEGESAGIARLFLKLRAKNANQFNLGIVRLAAEVHAAPAMNEYEMKKCPFVGYGEQHDKLGRFSMGSEQDWRFSVLLHPNALTVIERVRNKGDLFLAVRFFCTATYMKDKDSPLTNLELVSVYGEAHSGTHSYFKVPQSEWIKTLKDLGYGDYFLMEIPLKGVPGRRGMQKAVEHLKAAWEHFEQGNDDETLVSCYKAFEYLAKRSKFKHPDQNAFERILCTIPEEDKRRRLKVLMHDLCQFLTLGRHEPGTEAVMIDGRDSEYGLIVSQATLNYLAKVMRETAAE